MYETYIDKLLAWRKRRADILKDKESGMTYRELKGKYKVSQPRVAELIRIAKYEAQESKK